MPPLVFSTKDNHIIMAEECYNRPIVPEGIIIVVLATSMEELVAIYLQYITTDEPYIYFLLNNKYYIVGLHVDGSVDNNAIVMLKHRLSKEIKFMIRPKIQVPINLSPILLILYLVTSMFGHQLLNG
jgi:hypothetical protein